MPRFVHTIADSLISAARRIRPGCPGAAWLGRCCLGLLFPPRCACCDAELPPDCGPAMICDECCQRLGPDTWAGCSRCGASIAPGSNATGPCRHCQGFRLHFETVVPLGMYDDLLRESVLKLKRPAHESVSVALGKLLAQRRGDALAALCPNVIIPIPMHWWRRLQRGTNSPEIVAQCLARRLKVRLTPRALVRRRNTLPQKDLLPRERIDNVRGAFRVGRCRGVSWKDLHVLLVDDILTTGATCSEAARVLKQAGAARVSVAVLAKAQGDK